MKTLLKTLLMLSGLRAGTALGQEVLWRPAARPSEPAAASVLLGRPQPLPPAGRRGHEPIFRGVAPTSPIRPVKAEEPADKKDAAPAPPPAAPPGPPPNGRDVWGSYGPANPGWGPWEPADIPATCSEPLDGGCKPHKLIGLGAGSWYFRGEYLLWGIKESKYPVLLSTGPIESRGFLSDPRTTVLVGGDEVGTGPYSGGRFTLGTWLDCDQTFGIESTTFFLGQRGPQFLVGSGTYPLLTRPFFKLNDGTESGELATIPGISVGSVRIDAPSRLWGTELNLRCNWCCGCWGRLDWLSGVRYLDLDEGLHITEDLQNVVPVGNLPAGTQQIVADRFDTRNQFFGGQFGLAWEVQRGPWSLEMRGKLALGTTHQTVTTVGAQLVRQPDGTTTVANGGLLALPTNSGRFTRDRFSVVPEVGVTLGYNVTDWWRLTVGYSFLYWSSVVRPADQIDRVIDINNIPNFDRARPTGVVRPAPTLRDTDFWAQGVNFGMEFRW